jgi:hypothetical protein
MLVFPRWVEHAFDVAVQGSYDANASEHSWPVMFHDQQKSLYHGLPFFGIVFRLGQFSDVVRGVAEGEQRCSAWQYLIP